jgi:hypothetical protein
LAQEEYDMRLDFVGVGPQRAGTSWLHQNFMHHPEVCLPQAPVKETFYFDERHHYGLSWYKKYFPADSDQFMGSVGEFGPSYFDVSEASHRIYQLNPECKILINLRNPVDRAYSVFLHYLKHGLVPPDFTKAIEQEPRLLSCGHYKVHVQRWIDVFGADNIHYVVLDDIKQQPLPTLNKICRFLGIGEFPAHEAIREPVNMASLYKNSQLHGVKHAISRFARKHHQFGMLMLGRKIMNFLPSRILAQVPDENYPKLSTEQRQFLYNLYHEDIVFVERLLQRSFTSWRIDSTNQSLILQQKLS